MTVIGPENLGSHFEKHKTAFEEGGGRDDALVEDGASAGSHTPQAGAERESEDALDEKASVRQKESAV
jgi:SHS family lactate transporter-like MFS transporter